jgi:predicted DNA-binding transcriptional regulator AlpA
MTLSQKLSAKDIFISEGQLINSKEASHILGISTIWFYTKIRTSQLILPHIKLNDNRTTRFRKSDVLKLKESMKHGGNRFDEESSEEKAYLTIRQTADMIGVVEGTLYVWRAKKRFAVKSKRINGRIRYKMCDIKKYLDSKSTLNVKKRDILTPLSKTTQ